tara:strand:+ start:544 stop:1245 length:702 start_codon:yes stop_codon:yes gene_type:complete
MSTLSELRTRARRLADAVGNNFFADAEVDDYINIGLGELHDILVSKFEDYSVSSISFPLIADQKAYTFSSIGLGNFYKAIGVDLIDGNDTVRLARYSFQERNTFSENAAYYSRSGRTNLKYNINGNSITFMPKTSGTYTVKIWYIPQFTRLKADDDSVDNNITSNWEDYAVTLAALKMRQKEETTTTSLEREIDRLGSRIEEASRNRDAGEPMGITDESMGLAVTSTGHDNWP